MFEMYKILKGKKEILLARTIFFLEK